MIDLDDSRLFKAQSIGLTFELTALKNPNQQVAHLIFRIPNSGSQFSSPFFGCKVVFLTQTAKPTRNSNRLFDDWLVLNCPISVWHCDSPVYTFRVWHEKDAAKVAPQRCYVNERFIFPLPDAMKLSFEPEVCNFADQPPELLFAAVSNNVLFNDRETLLQWLTSEGLTFHVDGIACLKGATK